MFLVMTNGEVVFESSSPAKILAYLRKSGSPAGSLILQVFTPQKFRKTHESLETSRRTTPGQPRRPA